MRFVFLVAIEKIQNNKISSLCPVSRQPYLLFHRIQYKMQPLKIDNFENLLVLLVLGIFKKKVTTLTSEILTSG